MRELGERKVIVRCEEREKPQVFRYIGEDYGKCLYIYIDLKKYSLGEEHFRLWRQVSEDGAIRALITEYYGGFQVYSRDLDHDAAEIGAFLQDVNPPNVFGAAELIGTIAPYLRGYRTETGQIGALRDLRMPESPDANPAEEGEIAEIAALVARDEAIGKPYGYDSLYRQYLERKRAGFGRNYIIRDAETGSVICHAGTYAELPELAIMGGVITDPAYRGQGYSKGVIASLCGQLLREGKQVFSFYYTVPAERMHEKMGFVKLTDWAKLIR